MKQKNKNKKNKKSQTSEDQLFDFDNEIIIGIKKIPEEKKEKPAKKNRKNKKSKNKPENITKKKNKNKIIENIEEPPKKNKRIRFFIKGVLAITIVLTVILFLFLSPLFNIEEITVQNNSKISEEEIIDMSEINIGDNIFKINKTKVEKKLKQNPYIESIKLERNFPSAISIIVKERKATFMLETTEGEYAYINNQGYILEINQETINAPKVTSYKTVDLSAGKRLNDEDLEKLEVVLKIMEIAKANQIGQLITQIDIANRDNLIIRLESEKKTVYLGDASDINTKMLYIKATLEDEKDIEGELFMDGKTNKEGEFLFREKV